MGTLGAEEGGLLGDLFGDGDGDGVEKRPRRIEGEGGMAGEGRVCVGDTSMRGRASASSRSFRVGSFEQLSCAKKPTFGEEGTNDRAVLGPAPGACACAGLRTAPGEFRNSPGEGGGPSGQSTRSNLDSSSCVLTRRGKP